VLWSTYTPLSQEYVKDVICNGQRSDTLLSSASLKKGGGMRRITLLFAALALASLACVGALLALPMAPARGDINLPGFTQSQVVSGLTGPMDMEFAPDGRLFVAEEAGKLRVLRSNGNLATFLDISTRVDSGGERGLMGVAFDPNYSTNRFIYLYYTRKATSTTPVHNRIVRFTAKSSGSGVVAGSEQLLLRLNNQSTNYHLGGAIDFGNDGKLYASTGDNGTPAKAQQLTNLFGKMVRINKDGTIPSDNPFYSTATGNNRAIWALGLRNPFKLAVSRTTGAMFINDVGGNIPEEAWEEINRGVAGANFGWPVHEGVANDPPYVDPIFAYGHIPPSDGSTDNTGCAITGGAFYEPASVRFPDSYFGDYFFADLCNGWIRSYDTATDTASGFATGLSSVVDLEVSNDGELYFLSRGSPGTVGKITSSGT
jgi:glucose/arabinose dehydrogenase